MSLVKSQCLDITGLCMVSCTSYWKLNFSWVTHENFAKPGKIMVVCSLPLKILIFLLSQKSQNESWNHHEIKLEEKYLQESLLTGIANISIGKVATQ